MQIAEHCSLAKKKKTDIKPCCGDFVVKHKLRAKVVLSHDRIHSNPSLVFLLMFVDLNCFLYSCTRSLSLPASEFCYINSLRPQCMLGSVLAWSPARLSLPLHPVVCEHVTTPVEGAKRLPQAKISLLVVSWEPHIALTATHRYKTARQV